MRRLGDQDAINMCEIATSNGVMRYATWLERCVYTEDVQRLEETGYRSDRWNFEALLKAITLEADNVFGTQDVTRLKLGSAYRRVFPTKGRFKRLAQVDHPAGADKAPACERRRTWEVCGTQERNH